MFVTLRLEKKERTDLDKLSDELACKINDMGYSIDIYHEKDIFTGNPIVVLRCKKRTGDKK